MTVWPWFISAPKWVSWSNALWGCLYLRGHQLWARKQQGWVRHQVSACRDTCIHPSEGKTTQYILFISLLAGRGLELWHGSLEFENHLSSVSVHIWYLGRWGYAHFLARLQQDTSNLGGSWKVKFILMINFSYKKLRSQSQRVWCYTSYQQQIFERLWWPGEGPETWKKMSLSQRAGRRIQGSTGQLTSPQSEVRQVNHYSGLVSTGLDYFSVNHQMLWVIRALAKAITSSLKDDFVLCLHCFCWKYLS